MGFWSKLKSLAKKVGKFVKNLAKAVVRIVIRIAIILSTVPLKSFDLTFGWLAWPKKRLRLHIAVLQNASGPLIIYKDLETLWPSINLLRQTFKDHGN